MARTRPLQPTEVELQMLKNPLRAERENCRDDLAVATLGNRVEYGRAFLAIEEIRGRSTVLAVGASDGSLLARIRRIVGTPSNTGVSSPWAPLSLVICGIAVACTLSVFSWAGMAQSPEGASEEVSKSGDVNSERIDDSFAVPSGKWPMWGGSPHRNHVAGGRMPADWDLETGRNVLWKSPLGTQTYASPVVSGGKVFIGTNNGAALDPRRAKGQDLSCLVCLDQTTGKLLWRYASEKLPTGRVHDWPEIGLCSTACVVGDRLWIVTNRCEVLCLDTEGFRDNENDGAFTDETNRTEFDADVVWKFDMFNTLGVRPLHQAVSSIAVVDGLVLLNTSNSPNESRDSVPAPQAPNFLALDARTGQVIWQDNSAGESIIIGGSSCGCSGTSPAVATIGGVTQAIFAGREGWLYGFDFADLKHGKTTQLWKFDCNPKTSGYTKGGASTRNTLVASPVVVGDHIFIATGRDPEQGEGTGDLWCVDATRRGDISSELVFNNSHLGGREPIAHKPLCACDPKQGDFTRPNPNSGAIWHYASSDRDGDGKLAFEESFHRSLGSPAIYDGLLFIADFSGLMHCIDARTGEGLWVDDLLATVWSSCVIADGKVLIGDGDGNVTLYEAARMRQRVHGDDVPYFGSSIYSTPAVASETLFVATKDSLVAIREKLVNAKKSLSVGLEPTDHNVTPLQPAPPELDELDVLHEKFKRALPRNWAVYRQERAFEFRGPNGPTEATKSEQAQMTLWFSDLFYDSRTLQRRDPKLTRILSWGRTRLGQVLSTRNEAAIENWQEFGDVLYWLLPNEHVAIIGDIDLYQKIDGQNSLISLIYTTSRSVIDLRIDDEGNRVHNHSRALGEYGISPKTDFVVIGKEPKVDEGMSAQEQQRVLRQQTQFQLAMKGAREYGVRTVLLQDYITRLRKLKEEGLTQAWKESNDGDSTLIPEVPVPLAEQAELERPGEFPVVYEGVIDDVLDDMLLLADGREA